MVQGVHSLREIAPFSPCAPWFKTMACIRANLPTYICIYTLLI